MRTLKLLGALSVSLVTSSAVAATLDWLTDEERAEYVRNHLVLGADYQIDIEHDNGRCSPNGGSFAEWWCRFNPEENSCGSWNDALEEALIDIADEAEDRTGIHVEVGEIFHGQYPNDHTYQYLCYVDPVTGNPVVVFVDGYSDSIGTVEAGADGLVTLPDGGSMTFDDSCNPTGGGGYPDLEVYDERTFQLELKYEYVTQVEPDCCVTLLY